MEYHFLILLIFVHKEAKLNLFTAMNTKTIIITSYYFIIRSKQSVGSPDGAKAVEHYY